MDSVFRIEDLTGLTGSDGFLIYHFPDGSNKISTAFSGLKMGSTLLSAPPMAKLGFGAFLRKVPNVSSLPVSCPSSVIAYFHFT